MIILHPDTDRAFLCRESTVLGSLYRKLVLTIVASYARWRDSFLSSFIRRSHSYKIIAIRFRWFLFDGLF